MDLKKIKLEYEHPEFSEKNLDKSPLVQLKNWMQVITEQGVTYPNACVLSTIDNEGSPDSRIVLIKEINHIGPCFFTSYDSPKAKHIQHHNKICLMLFWKELDRQIRLYGEVHKTDRKVNEDYFNSRPRSSQINAHASPQGYPISKEDLDKNVEFYAQKFQGEEIPCPENWGGYQMVISKAEFWQGRPNRLHDRFVYTQEGQSWKIQRLGP